jgi:hypothetical protein
MSATRWIELSEFDGNLTAECAIILDLFNLKFRRQSRTSRTSRSEIAIHL